MPKVLIASLGGTPDPVVKSIETHKPDYLYFFSSQESNAKEYPTVKKKLDELGMSPKIESVIVDDVNDLVHCYEKASELTHKIEKRGIPPEDVVVDYTGGTKTMSAALTLATITKFTKFSYVGGKERTKEGLGVVISGTEEIKTALSPWQVLLVEERKKIALFFNGYQFSAAKDLTERLARNLTGVDKALFECLSNLIEGYMFWDSFNHNEALKALGPAVKRLSDYLHLNPDPVLMDFSESVKLNLGFLQTIKGNKEAMVFDLIHNAKRRSQEGKYDDASARLYRALEMIGQIEFEKQFQCSTSDVKIEKLPESIRDEMRRRHTAPDGRVKIPLYDVFVTLKESGNGLGASFFERGEEMERILYARNGSILAHGINPISEETFKRLSSIVENFITHTGADEKVTFPKLLWE